MTALADLVGAVRLPTGAHRRAAGSDALMDLLLLRRRPPEDPFRDASWETTRLVDVDAREARINSYLAEHPELVLGELAVGQGMYGADTLHVRPHGTLDDTPAQLADTLHEVVDRARELGLLAGPRGTPNPVAAAADPSRQLAREGMWDGHITALKDARFTVTSEGLLEALKVPASHRAELRVMLEHSKGAGGLTVRRLEKQILREEERLQALLDSPRDPGLTFEQSFSWQDEAAMPSGETSYRAQAQANCARDGKPQARHLSCRRSTQRMAAA